jgi:hypothetical protein
MIDLKTETAQRLERKLDIPLAITFALFETKLIDERTAKRFLIKDDFESLSPERGTKEEAADLLAQDYCVSFETAMRCIKRRYK